VIQSLSSPRELEAQRVRIGIEYVPLRFRQDAMEPEPTDLVEEIDTAKRMFSDMRPPHRHRSTILLGSQRVNHLVELFVADTFRCTPFHQLKRGRPKVPFYLVYREDDRAVPSCFGGPQHPPSCAKPSGPGIYFDSPDGWIACPWIENEQDAGVIIVVRDLGTEALEMAVFGFSGQGTEAVGEELFKHPNRFWPPGIEVDGNQVGVYICRFSFTEQATADDGGDTIITDAEVIQLDEQVLRKYVR
jgi:hypothetical protein